MNDVHNATDLDLAIEAAEKRAREARDAAAAAERLYRELLAKKAVR